MMKTENRAGSPPRRDPKKTAAPAGRRLAKKELPGWLRACGEVAVALKPWAGRLLFLPALILYLEILLHIYMGMDLRYAPVYLVFSLAAGFLLSAVTLALPPRAGSVSVRVGAGVVTLVYAVELVAKSILQTYYPLSILGTASENRLADYTGVILEQLAVMVPVLALLLLPLVLLLVFHRRVLGGRRRIPNLAVLALLAAVLTHLLGLGIVHLPWQGDLTPSALYRMDSAIDDQVEQLGLWTMLRLDVKHMILPPEGGLSHDFSALEDLGAAGGTGEGDGPAAPVQSGAPAEEEPVIDTSPNVMDVDLAALAESASNDSVVWLANYFNSVTPTNKNEYTGMFEGYNVIQVVMEGFSGYAPPSISWPTRASYSTTTTPPSTSPAPPTGSARPFWASTPKTATPSP